MNDRRRYAPATLRNREPILAALRQWFPERGSVLEIASGTGEHAVFFARALPHLVWQPSDPDPDALASIAAHAAAEGLNNLLPPVLLDVTTQDWPVASADALLCCNMIHIAPWAATLGLFSGAALRLKAGAPLVLYGPFRQAGVPTAPSNEAFDADLRQRDPRWGLRDLEEVVGVAKGFVRHAVVPMPANNLAVCLRKAD